MRGQPPCSIAPEEARRQRLLRLVFVAVIAISAIVALAALVPGLDLPWTTLTAAITGMIGLVYVMGIIILGMGHTRTASGLLVGGVFLGTWVPIMVPGSIDGGGSYVFTVASVMIASYALSARAGLAVAGLNTIGLTSLWRLRDAYGTHQFAEDMLLFAVLASIVIGVAWFNQRDRQEIQDGRTSLQHALETQSALMDNSPDAIVAVDPAGSILSANQVAIRWARQRFHAHLVPGMDVRLLLPTHAAQEWQSLLEEARRSGAVRSEMLWDDDGPNWFQIFLHATATGSITVQVRDVSEDRRTELRERQAYRDRIELDKLREMDSFRLRLLNTASHELRTPITPLRLQLSILGNNLPDTSPARHSMEVMARNLDRLAVLVDDLLDVARLEGDQMPLEKQHIELDAFLHRELEGYEAVALEKGVKIEVVAESHASVDGDPARLAQVFTNLLSNALKYTDRGGRIDIAARMHGGKAVVEVRDDGAGFPPSRASRLFEPFTQLHEGAERRAGTGLGLYICKGIVERHGGTIWGRSDGPGKGAEFGFNLPVRATLKHKVGPLVQP